MLEIRLNRNIRNLPWRVFEKEGVSVNLLAAFAEKRDAERFAGMRRGSVYTLIQIKQGTGFEPDAQFVHVVKEGYIQ